MKKLIKLNLVIWFIVFIIPSISKQDIIEVTNLIVDTISFSIENVKEQDYISSRSGNREIVTELHITEKSILLLKSLERI